MAIISIQEAQTWAERTKLTLSSLDSGLEAQCATQVLGRIALAYDVSGWTTNLNTPSLVRSIIAMTYVSWLYSKTYSEDEAGSNEYALRLLAMAETLITGITGGSITLPEVPPEGIIRPEAVSFYPTDLSSALCPTPEDPSLGGARFTMGQIF